MRLGLAVALGLALLAGGAAAQTAEGTTTLAGKQLPLPPGRW
ncbi:MAG: hypothetical protein U1E53_08560 [Dongiaceae bacterium]